MLKPEVIPSEACHRLALSEGQKEKKEKGGKESKLLDVNTRRLTVRTFVLLLTGLLLSSSIFTIVKAPTITPTSEPALDGYICKKGENQYPPNQQTVVSTTSSLIRVGERVMEIINGMESYMYYKYRGYVSFDTSSIPSEHLILSATLKLCIASSYPPDRNFELRVKGGTQPIYGDSLDANDWEAGSTTIATWNTANYPGRDHWIELQIFASQINRNGRTQFRLVSSLDEANQEPPVIPTNEELVIAEDTFALVENVARVTRPDASSYSSCTRGLYSLSGLRSQELEQPNSLFFCCG